MMKPRSVLFSLYGPSTWSMVSAASFFNGEISFSPLITSRQEICPFCSGMAR